MANWERFNENLGQGVNSLMAQQLEQRKRQQEFNDALQMMMIQSQIKAQFDPEAQMRRQLLDLFTGGGQPEGQGQPRGQMAGGGFKPKSFTYGGLTMERQPTEQEFQQAQQRKVEEQSALAAGKETSVNISKVQRLETIGRRIEKEWLTTSPYSRKNLSIKVGLMPLLGAWDVVKSNLQATPAQENDKAYRNFVNLIRAQLARGMGDVGNLSEYEQAAVVGGIPTLMDTKETGIKKLQKIFRLVQDIRNARNRGNMLIGQNKYAPMNNDQQQGEFKQDNTYLWEE